MTTHTASRTITVVVDTDSNLSDAPRVLGASEGLNFAAIEAARDAAARVLVAEAPADAPLDPGHARDSTCVLDAIQIAWDGPLPACGDDRALARALSTLLARRRRETSPASPGAAAIEARAEIERALALARMALAELAALEEQAVLPGFDPSFEPCVEVTRDVGGSPESYLAPVEVIRGIAVADAVRPHVEAAVAALLATTDLSGIAVVRAVAARAGTTSARWVGDTDLAHWPD